MFSKKIFYSITLAVLSSPIITHASFDTFNYTNEDSSVRITSGSYKPCSMDFGVYTPQKTPDGSPGHSSANDSQIRVLCMTSSNNICNADIYNTKNCTGTKVGHASLNLTTYKIEEAISDDISYIFDNQNGKKLNIKYAQ